MSLILYKTIAGLLIFITSLIAVIYPIKIRARVEHNLALELGDAFASGIFLGAALFHMLPDAITGFQQVATHWNYPIAEFLCAIGFLILLFFERLAEYTASKRHNITVPYILAIILIVHSLIEGGVLGMNTTLATASVIFIAIIAHKGSESFALAVTLNRYHLSFSKMIFIIALFSVMTPLGIVFGTELASATQFKNGPLFAAGFNAFAAGTFLYMSTLHHINHHPREHEGEGLWEFLFLLIGLSVMAALAGF